jgi:thiol-disulfide isomerase/thioredoxin
MTGQQRAQAAGRAILGTPAPRLVLKTIDGDAIDLGSLYGKQAVYLKFWATWCVPCRQQMPHFQHAYETAGADLAVIAIDVGFNDSVEAIRAYRQKLGITMPIVFDDGSLAAAFHLRVTPTHIVIGRDGRIRYIGHLADGELDAALIAARAPAGLGPQTAAAVNETRRPPWPLGICCPRSPCKLSMAGASNFGAGAAPHSLTVLVFLSPWCESYLATTRPEAAANCRSAREQFGELSADPRIRWLGVASGLVGERRGRCVAIARMNKITIPLTLDSSGEIYRLFRVNDVPTVLIADSGGRIVRRIEGNATLDAARCARPSRLREIRGCDYSSPVHWLPCWWALGAFPGGGPSVGDAAPPH